MHLCLKINFTINRRRKKRNKEKTFQLSERSGKSMPVRTRSAAKAEKAAAGVDKPLLWRDGISSFIEHGGLKLNQIPALLVTASMVAVFGCASYFLQHHVITANSCHVVFLVGSYVVFSSYFTFDYFLKEYSTSYREIPSDKKFYVLSNLIKSAVLLSYSPLAFNLLVQSMHHDVWDTNKIRIMGTLYCIPDFVSLFVVKRMANSTKIHHIVVCVFNLISVYNDYEEVNVIRAIMVYAVFSTFAYMVNLLLASRFLKTSYFVRVALSATALVIYASCCGVNWCWQVWFLSTIVADQLVAVVLYSALVLFLVWDDLILMKWLYVNLKRNSLKNDEKAD